MRAADALCEALKAEGVEHVFGIPGGANLPTYDASTTPTSTHIQARHEQGAGHAAEGYAKASGRVGVAFATSGPGATNLVTAIADAMMDSVPTVFITGQVRTDLIGTDGFQEADVTGITMPIVKHSLPGHRPAPDPRVHPRGLPHRLHRAPRARCWSTSRRTSRGPTSTTSRHRARPNLPGYKPSTEGNIKQIRIAAKALANAQRPGDLRRRRRRSTPTPPRSCASSASSDNFPVTCTVMGLGAFPAPHEQWLGMLGMHGTRTANYAMDDADLIVAVGARFDDRITGKLSEFAPRAKFVHIDVDPAEISKNVPAHIPIVGDAKEVLPKLTNEYRALEADSLAPRRLVGADPRLAGGVPARLRGLRPTREIKPQFMVEAMYEATEGDAIITSDVGQHQMWAAQYYHFAKPRRWINSGGLGTMGFGLPAAIGAKVAQPDETVVCLAGDGSLIMICQEFATAVRHEIPVKVFLMNNGYFGMVRQWQELFWDGRYSSVEMGPSPDWSKLAEAFGVDRHAGRRQGRARGRDARRARDRGPGAARRPRHQGRRTATR